MQWGPRLNLQSVRDLSKLSALSNLQALALSRVPTRNMIRPISESLYYLTCLSSLGVMFEEQLQEANEMFQFQGLGPEPHVLKFVESLSVPSSVRSLALSARLDNTGCSSVRLDCFADLRLISGLSLKVDGAVCRALGEGPRFILGDSLSCMTSLRSLSFDATMFCGSVLDNDKAKRVLAVEFPDSFSTLTALRHLRVRCSPGFRLRAEPHMPALPAHWDPGELVTDGKPTGLVSRLESESAPSH